VECLDILNDFRYRALAFPDFVAEFLDPLVLGLFEPAIHLTHLEVYIPLE
jgi:hypothetical protein